MDEPGIVPKSDFMRLPAVERYERDAAFHVLVDTLYVQIKQSHYTPTELREACHLAACMYEARHIRPMFYDPKRPFEWSIKEKP